MQYTSLGRSGLQVSRLALGTMNFGELTDEPASFAIMNAALEAGINFLDTADVYGGPQRPDMEKGFGISEEIIGRWLAQDRGRRDRIVLATKLYQPMATGPNDRGLSAYHIRRACEASLRRLQTDHIDLYQMHHVDRRTPWDEIWQAMEQLVREGKVTYVGSSNFAGWDIATAQSVASSRHFLGLASEQSLYNLTARTVELEVIPALRHYGICLMPWSPIGMGLLGGVLRKAREGRRATPQLQMRIEQHRPQLEQYEALCQQLGEEPAGRHPGASPATRQQQAKAMKIRIDVDGTSVTATFDDTAAARDFASLLPLTLTLEDYNRTEKISDLPKKLSTQGAPEGVEPSRGDIAYYAPWGNLAIFYKGFTYSRGLVKLGRIDSGIEMFEQARALTVTLRRVDD